MCVCVCARARARVRVRVCVTRDGSQCLKRDSNPQPPQSSGRKPMS